MFHWLQISVLSLLPVDLLQKSLIPEHRGVAHEDVGIRRSVKNQLFPENTEGVALVKADLSIPALHKTVAEEVRTWSNPDSECSFSGKTDDVVHITCGCVPQGSLLGPSFLLTCFADQLDVTELGEARLKSDRCSFPV